MRNRRSRRRAARSTTSRDLRLRGPLRGPVDRLPHRSREPAGDALPGGALDTATALYQDWAVSRYLSAIAGRCCPPRSRPPRAGRCGCSRWAPAPAAPRRCWSRAWLQIGARTGSPTCRAAFLARAQGGFGTYPFVRYAALDVEREPAEQGFAAASFDVVVATNVVHATRDVEATLGRLRALLAPGGLLILGEATTHLSWFDVTTGLIEGWQRFEDHRADRQPPARAGGVGAAPRAAAASTPTASLPEAGVARDGAGATRRGRPRCPRLMRTRAASTGGRRANAVAAELRPPVTRPRRSGTSRDGCAAARRPTAMASRCSTSTDQVAAVLRVRRAEALDPRQRLMDLGLDSLMALELRGRLAVGLGRAGGVPATLVFEHPTIDAIARFVVREAVGVEASGPASGRRGADAVGRRRRRPASRTCPRTRSPRCS